MRDRTDATDPICYHVRMRWLRGLLAAVVTTSALAVAATGAAAPGCPPTVPDAFGPFGRGMPPVRASIGTGHVLTGVVVSSLDCKPIRGARVELWQANARGAYVRALSGTVITDRNGRFRFQGPYPARYEGTPPHIHLRVVAPAHEVLLSRFVPAPRARRGSITLVLVTQAV